MTTVREIAEFAGVSKSTVSLVLNNKAGVSDEMRQTVMDAVSELELLRSEEMPSQYEQLSHANEAKSQATSVMVLHPPVLRSSYVFGEVLQGIQAAAEIYNVQLRLVANDPHASTQHVSNLYLSDSNLRPDGILVFGAQQHEPFIEKVIERNIPCVVLGREASKYNVSGIERDEMHCAYELTQHLIEVGHENIGFVGGETIYDYTTNRLHGYQNALNDADIVAKDKWVCLGNGSRATETLLADNPDLSAIIFVNDSYALEGLSVIEAQGISIPNDLAVASFDDTDIARCYQPAITSISYNLYKEGQWAVKMLLEQIRYPFLQKVQITFQSDLIVRESTLLPVPSK